MALAGLVSSIDLTIVATDKPHITIQCDASQTLQNSH